MQTAHIKPGTRAPIYLKGNTILSAINYFATGFKGSNSTYKHFSKDIASHFSQVIPFEMIFSLL